MSVLPVDLPLMLLCDRARLEMALANLLDNAFNFTLPRGQIELAAEPGDGFIRLSVSDTGAGIHPDDLQHIFERFYRGRRRNAPGSGLGLAIAESLVQAQGGHIYAESELGAGARFIIEFPIGEQAPG